MQPDYKKAKLDNDSKSYPLRKWTEKTQLWDFKTTKFILERKRRKPIRLDWPYNSNGTSPKFIEHLPNTMIPTYIHKIWLVM